jgi:Cysteine-rich secretory protein family
MFSKVLWLGLIAVTFLLFAVCSVAAQPANKVTEKCSGSSGLTQDEVTELLNAHNKIREKLNLGDLMWDCKLAAFAQEWAQRGIPEHREDSDYGENIFVAGDGNIAAITAVDRWLLERPMWFNEAGACTFNQICTHYTQVVWKKTTRIGCGIFRNAPAKWKVLLVCNYDPAGNSPGPAY